jgi:hypothetical protein
MMQIKINPRWRVREIRKAQDALTLKEKRVYEALWGNKDQSHDRERVVMKGYDTVANESLVAKRNVVNVIHRLIEKGFVQLVAPPTIFWGSRTPTTYKVLSYAAAREHQKRRGREYVTRLGTGIFYVKTESPHKQPKLGRTVKVLWHGR